MPIITPRPVPEPIPQGNPIQVTVSFNDADGNLFDPDHGILIRAVSPSGTTSTHTYNPGDISRDGVGKYSVVVEVTVGGDWVFKGQGTLADGKIITSPDIVQRVDPSQIA